MLTEIDKRFDEIKAIFQQRNSSTEMICKAYDIAKSLHKEQKRKDGQLYISHPVEVALILAHLDFDEKVISAALLHDVVEDCDFTLEEIRKEFDYQVAQMVDCVSAIDKAKFVFDENDIYENKEFEKAAIEEQSFKKLIAIGKENPLGFCIKFADRLHNLRTIQCFPHSKQLEKVKETEKWIVPIAKTLNAEYFYRAIKNECFKIKHLEDGKDFFEHYAEYLEANAKNANEIIMQLQRIFANSTKVDVKMKPIREYKVYEQLEGILKNININKVSQGQILRVANYSIYLLFNEKEYDNNAGAILEILNKRLKDVRIIDARIGTFTKKPHYQLEDKYKNKYNLYIETYAEYIKQRNGTLDGQNSELLDDDNIDNMDIELIKVKTRSGEIKYVAQGSTVLDFAFKIHKDIGFGFKYAIINKSKTKSPPYTKLYEGDQVEIIVEKDEEGNTKNNAELRWFAYVNSDLAKKVLIKHFEKEYLN